MVHRRLQLPKGGHPFGVWDKGFPGHPIQQFGRQPRGMQSFYDSAILDPLAVRQPDFIPAVTFDKGIKKQREVIDLSPEFLCDSWKRGNNVLDPLFVEAARQVNANSSTASPLTLKIELPVGRTR
jgi:hypothetical protein